MKARKKSLLSSCIIHLFFFSVFILFFCLFSTFLNLLFRWSVINCFESIFWEVWRSRLFIYFTKCDNELQFGNLSSGLNGLRLKIRSTEKKLSSHIHLPPSDSSGSNERFNFQPLNYQILVLSKLRFNKFSKHFPSKLKPLISSFETLNRSRTQPNAKINHLTT